MDKKTLTNWMNVKEYKKDDEPDMFEESNVRVVRISPGVVTLQMRFHGRARSGKTGRSGIEKTVLTTADLTADQVQSVIDQLTEAKKTLAPYFME